MNVRLYNTLTGQKEPFEPAEPDHARVYVCGPTVYDYAHLGHARCYVVYDVLVRHLRADGLKVTYVRNVTDVDDKILKRAAETGTEPTVLAARFADAYSEDMHRLGNLDPDVEPRVSTHLEDIFALVQRLVDGDHAYVSDGDVYFSVESFSDYGKPPWLAHRVLGDVDEAPRRYARPPRRRLGSGFPTPRKRDRPKRGRHRKTVCAMLDAQRVRRGR